MPNHKKKKNHGHSKKDNHNCNKAKTDATTPKKEESQKDSCNLYEIKVSDVMGRYLVATKALQPGQLIIQELPLVIGPPIQSGPVCLGCLSELKSFKNSFRCPYCNWPLCDAKCNGFHQTHGHSKNECDIFGKNKTIERVQDYSKRDLMVAYEIILQLRCLLLKLSDTDKWKQLITMESHNELRRKVKWLWERNQTEIVDRIQKDWNIEDFTEEEIHTVCGIIEVNCFEVGHEGAAGRALFPTAYILAHDCSPNSTHIDNPNNFAMSIRTMRNVGKGEALTVNYGFILMGTLKRRERLQVGKFFWCECTRCADPTEFGTYCSALKCESCLKGLILPTDPLDQEAVWKCVQCSHAVDAKSISTLLDKLFNELDAIDPMNVLGQERFLEKYKNILGENHYLILSAKYNLCQLYGRAAQFLIDSLSEDLLLHKEKYCREILKVISVLEPGLSRTKGIVMYELHVPLLLLAYKKLEKRQINKVDFMKAIKEIVKLLEESCEILKNEPGEKEQDMLHGAEVALMNLKMQKLL